MATSSKRTDAPSILPIARPPAEKTIKVQGRPWLIVVWDARQWARLPESDRPEDAFAVGPVWMVVRPSAV